MYVTLHVIQWPHQSEIRKCSEEFHFQKNTKQFFLFPYASQLRQTLRSLYLLLQEHSSTYKIKFNVELKKIVIASTLFLMLEVATSRTDEGALQKYFVQEKKKIKKITECYLTLKGEYLGKKYQLDKLVTTQGS